MKMLVSADSLGLRTGNENVFWCLGNLEVRCRWNILRLEGYAAASGTEKRSQGSTRCFC